MKDNLKLYYIDMKYVRELSNADDHVMSVSPQSGKENRPFIGILTLVHNKKYCIPLTSSNKEKFKNKRTSVDCIRIFDDTIKDENGAPVTIGILNVNNMIPVDKSFLKPIDIKIYKDDAPHVKKRKIYLTKQLDWCQKNEHNILSHANKLYDLVVNHPEQNKNLTRRCCNFHKLEAVLEKLISKKA